MSHLFGKQIFFPSLNSLELQLEMNFRETNSKWINSIPKILKYKNPEPDIEMNSHENGGNGYSIVFSFPLGQMIKAEMEDKKKRFR